MRSTSVKAQKWQHPALLQINSLGERNHHSPTSDLAASEDSLVLGKRTIHRDDLKILQEIPDSIQDKESLDIYRVQK